MQHVHDLKGVVRGLKNGSWINRKRVSKNNCTMYNTWKKGRKKGRKRRTEGGAKSMNIIVSIVS